jgi:hypothetical protein
MQTTPSPSATRTDSSPAGATQKKAWQTPQISLLGADDTETGAAAVMFEAMTSMACVAYIKNVSKSGCTVS